MTDKKHEHSSAQAPAVTTELFTTDDLARGETIVRELHGLKGFEAWSERIARALATERRRAQPQAAQEPEFDPREWENIIEDREIALSRGEPQAPTKDHALSIKIEQRPDGGVRIWSDQLPGLILSGRDPLKVMSDVWPAITELLAVSRPHQQVTK